MSMGHIYCITNLVNGKYYVGQTTRKPEYRFNDHMSGKSCSLGLFAAVSKYGRDNFEMSILATANDRDELDALEVLWILITSAMKTGVGYNRAVGGRTPRHTEETRAKQSAARIGKKQSPEYIEKRIAPLRGRKHSPERRMHTSTIARSQNRRPSPEACAKSAEVRRGKPAWNRGKKLGPSWNKGRKCTPEEIERNRRARLGTKLSDEHKAKISAALKGKMPAVNLRRMKP